MARIALGKYSDIDGVTLSDTRFHVEDPTLVRLSYCDLIDCDLGALVWESLRYCKLTRCLLPGDDVLPAGRAPSNCFVVEPFAVAADA